MKMFSKRLSAYVIDMIIFIFVLNLISMVIPRNDKLISLNEELNNLQNSYVNKEIDDIEYSNKYKELKPIFDKENIIINICNLVFIIGYFVVIPTINNGQTVGKKLMKIKIVKNNGNLNIIDMLLRNVIVMNLIQVIITTCFIYLLTNNLYYDIISFMGFVRISLVIITIFMILYRKDGKGIQDLITNSSVVEV